jgi:hypothetical protein
LSAPARSPRTANGSFGQQLSAPYSCGVPARARRCDLPLSPNFWTISSKLRPARCRRIIANPLFAPTDRRRIALPRYRAWQCSRPLPARQPRSENRISRSDCRVGAAAARCRDSAPRRRPRRAGCMSSRFARASSPSTGNRSSNLCQQSALFVLCRSPQPLPMIAISRRLRHHRAPARI